MPYIVYLKVYSNLSSITDLGAILCDYISISIIR
jgi:hypothetical protein